MKRETAIAAAGGLAPTGRSRLLVWLLVATAALMLSRPARADGIAPPKNVLVNDPTTDRFPNITQLEPSLAVFGSRVVLSWSDSGESQGKIAGLGFAIGFGYSPDGGATFTDGGALQGGGLNGSNWGANATLAADRSGNFYLGRFALVSNSFNAGASAGVTVFKSTDSGASFRQTVPPFGGLGGSADKPFLTVDNTGGPRDGTIYLTWAYSSNDILTIVLSRSTDGAATFSPPVTVSQPSGVNQYAMPAVGPNGELYIVWYELNNNQVLLRKSTDGGVTFGPITLVAAVNQIGSASICSTTSRSGFNGNIRAVNTPIIAVDTTSGSARGNVYVVVASAPVPGGRDLADVLLLRSTDGGATWDPPRRLNDDATTNDQWLPYVTVAPDGVVGAMWYDRRLDSGNLLIDVFMAVSTNGGASFGPNFRVTDVSFPVPPLSPNFDPLAATDCFMGDNNSMVADANNFYLAWTDNRQIASGVPDPNIYFAKIPIEPGPPAIITSPQSQTVNLGANVSFSALASGVVLGYQWLKNGAPIPDATASSYSIPAVQTSDVATYSVTVSNRSGSVVSGGATLTVSSAPQFTSQPVGRTIAAGSTMVFSVAANGTPTPTFQWRRDGIPIVGATSATLVITQSSAADAGNYTCVTTNPLGAATSAAATLDVSPTSDVGRLINLSILTNITANDPLFTVGTVVGGSGTSGIKSLLIRAAGPSLTSLGVSGVLADPKLDIFAGQTIIASNSSWAGDATLAAVFTAVGAFSYASAASKDAAVYNPAMPAGSYTVQISSVSGATGAVIAEIYDATPPAAYSAATPRLINVSVLKNIPAGNTLTAGFVIGGSTAKTILLRAIGPRLALAPFNIPAAMADPKLDLFSGQAVVTTNDNWGGDAQLAAVAAAVGAFAVTDAASKDAMLLVTLAPGSYTAQVSGVNNTGGLALVEVYEVP